MILTLGHSTRPVDDFITLLQTHQIEQLADVRTFPHSRRHPQFNGEALAVALAQHGIGYRHFPSLGGRRRPRPDSRNTAWREEGFRGYADYMEGLAFRRGVDALVQLAAAGLTAVMCAEAVWWRCHRRLLADALVARGIAVGHVLSSAAPKAHELSPFARIAGEEVTYPGLV